MINILGHWFLALMVSTAIFTFDLASAHAKSYRHPLAQIEIPLLLHNGILKLHDSKIINLRCALNIDDTNPQPVPLTNCSTYEVIQKLTEKNGVVTETVLGKFEKIFFSDFLAHLGAAYNPKYRVGPLAIATIYGFVGGGFSGGLAGAIAGGIAGFTIDLLKLPLALLYTLSSYGHRQIQQKRLFVRLNNLQFNRPYRPTRIISRKHYLEIVNALIEYLDHFHTSDGIERI